MTVIAHFEDVPAHRERRGAARRSLKLGLGGPHPVTIRDMSLTGMLIESPVPMLVGATFEMVLPHDELVPAVVVWNSGEFYGCEFHQPIPPAALSAAQLQSAPDRQMGDSRADPLAVLRDLSNRVDQIAFSIEGVIASLSAK